MPTRGENAAVPNVQYFWEAFPSGSGPTDRTTYLFTYIDADPSRCCVRPALASICMQGFPGICHECESFVSGSVSFVGVCSYS